MGRSLGIRIARAASRVAQVALEYQIKRIFDLFRVRIMTFVTGSGSSDNKPIIRKTVYVTIFLTLVLLSMTLIQTDWKGSAQVHTVMETIATMFAFVVGVSSLARYYTSKSQTFLLIGVGFIGAAFLDSYHVVVTSTFLVNAIPSMPTPLITWSGTASRTYLSLFMLLSWAVWRFDGVQIRFGKIRDYEMFLGVFAFIAIILAVVTLAPLPRTYFSGFFIHRPEELIPAVFFLLALVGYIRKKHWKFDDLEHWIVIFLLVSVITQVGFISLSGHMFDPRSDFAHGLKITCYLAVMTGLFIDYFHFFKRLTYQEEELKESIFEQIRIGNENAAVTGIARVIGSTLDIEEVYRHMAEPNKPGSRKPSRRKRELRIQMISTSS